MTQGSAASRNTPATSRTRSLAAAPAFSRVISRSSMGSGSSSPLPTPRSTVPGRSASAFSASQQSQNTRRVSGHVADTSVYSTPVGGMNASSSRMLPPTSNSQKTGYTPTGRTTSVAYSGSVPGSTSTNVSQSLFHSQRTTLTRARFNHLQRVAAIGRPGQSSNAATPARGPGRVQAAFQRGILAQRQQQQQQQRGTAPDKFIVISSSSSASSNSTTSSGGSVTVTGWAKPGEGSGGASSMLRRTLAPGNMFGNRGSAPKKNSLPLTKTQILAQARAVDAETHVFSCPL